MKNFSVIGLLLALTAAQGCDLQPRKTYSGSNLSLADEAIIIGKLFGSFTERSYEFSIYAYQSAGGEQQLVYRTAGSKEVHMLPGDYVITARCSRIGWIGPHANAKPKIALRLEAGKTYHLACVGVDDDADKVRMVVDKITNNVKP